MTTLALPDKQRRAPPRRRAGAAAAHFADSDARIGEDASLGDAGARGRGLADVRQAVEDETLATLLVASGRGDRHAFAAVYRATSPRLLGLAITLLRRRDLAEEVLQEAYLTIWRKARLYEPGKGTPEVWMAAIVRYRAIDRLRAGKRNPVEGAAPEEQIEPALSDGAQRLPEEAALNASLRQCLAKLGDKQREAILLAFYYGLTHEELAERLDVPLGTVKSWVRRGLQRMKELLEA